MTMVSGKQSRQYNVLVLGGTGSIGGGVAQSLSSRGHHVTCLARSQQSESVLRESNFNILKGDIRKPELWIEKAANFDAVIQAAITWSDDMGKVDSHLIDLLLDALSTSDSRKTLIYTGGCWLYGETGDKPATEHSPYCAIPDFSWGSDTGYRILEHPGVRGMVVHPAMVYERDGGVLEAMLCDVHHNGRVQILGSAETTWTMIHRDDLAELYCLVLEKGKNGENYNAAGIEAIKVERLARTLTKRFGLTSDPQVMPIDEAVSKFGSWAIGYALSQKMSSQKAHTELGWVVKHTDILSDIG